MASSGSTIDFARKVSTPAPSRVLRLGWLLAFLLLVGLQIAGIPYSYQDALASPKTIASIRSADPSPVINALSGAGISLKSYAIFQVIKDTMGVFLFSLFGLLIFWRRSSDRGALLISFLLILGNSNLLANQFLKSTGNVGIFGGQLLMLISSVAGYLIFFLFPNGRFVPRWTRWLVVVFVILVVPPTLFPGSRFDPNLLMSTRPAVLFILVLSVWAPMIFAPLYRYRRVSGPIERLQIRWVVTGLIALPVAWFTTGFLLPTLAPSLMQINANTIRFQILISLLILQPLYLALPVGIGISLLRYRLYDIDLIIRRTLIYTSLTAVMALVYSGSVVVIQQLFRALTGHAGQSPLAIVVSTLAIAALFNPLRRGIQNAIDRRFYRQKYNSEKVLAAFSTTLRNEVDLDQLTKSSLAVVEETMQPAHLSLWFRQPPGKGQISQDQFTAR